jgi:hypothetical protein
MKGWVIVSAAVLAGALGSPAASARESGERPAAETKAQQQGARHQGRGTRVRLGGISVGAGYSHFSGRPYFGGSYGLWPYSWGGWDPFFYPSYGWLGGFVDPGYYRGYRQGPGAGRVKLSTAAADGLVYLDGGYAGVAKDLKSMWLPPGAYNLEVRTDDESFSQRIYVLSGKTLHIEADLKPIEEEQP